ncbi:DUF2115 domain-containing protein [Methanobrevibacter sp.]
MFLKLKDLLNKDAISKNDILNIIKETARTMTLYDEMIASGYLQREGQFIQKSYREEYLKVTIQYFLNRLKKIKNENNDYHKLVDKSKFVECIDILEDQYTKQIKEVDSSNKTPLMYGIISIYTTLILEESIHPIDMPFPAGERIIYKDGIYYCPVKHNQLSNSTALCKLCIAKEKELLEN